MNPILFGLLLVTIAANSIGAGEQGFTVKQFDSEGAREGIAEDLFSVAIQGHENEGNREARAPNGGQIGGGERQRLRIRVRERERIRVHHGGGGRRVVLG
ncbi:unnamed protein product [Hermetia illucens]|uniref:Uncharacterized protein n=1 Tax=Hermetia illucens TaxID=343691 RepID=A0A7R8YL50_HERIL|nr:unnamed protein product [Hermetia illucens]